MRLRTLVAIALLTCSTAAFADQHDHSGQPPAMDPAMMEAMMKAATPGEAQKRLEAFVGTWDTKITMWMMPGTPPMTSSGTAENSMVMGGRHLEQRFKGDFQGMPFEGVGYTGYDNVRKLYWGSWMDNMSTGMMASTGKLAEDGKTFTFSGASPDPMTGKDTPFEEKIVLTDADHHTLEMWMPAPDGKMFKTMEIAYTRKK